MKVSVIVPAHDAERFIRRTLDSVMAQTHPDIETIVVDDGSTDSTARIVGGFGDRVRLVTGPCRGVCIARNEGFRLSTGESIAFLDHDDVWEPDKLRRQVEILRGDPGAGLVFTQARVEGQGDAAEIFPQIENPADLLADAHLNLLHWNFIPMSAVLVRRSVLESLEGPFDPRYRLSEDWDLWLRIVSRLPRGGIRFIAEPLTRYVIVEGRATERMADLRLEDIEIFRKQLDEHPGLVSRDPRRCRSTLYRLHEEAGYWLMKEGRGPEARRMLKAAWRLRPSSLKPLKYLVASVLRAGGSPG